MISALVVHRNGFPLLERCLTRLSADAGDLDLEILVVDNASEDDSRARLAERFPEVRVFPQHENLGFAAGNNLAAKEARGDRLLLLNNDAWLEAGAIAALARRLDSDPRLGLVAPQLRYADGTPQFTWCPVRSVLGEALQKALNPYEKSRWAHRSWLRETCRVLGPVWYSAACVLLRRQAFEDIGGFDEGYFMYFEDVDLCVRLGEAGWRLAQETGARVGHRERSGRGTIPDDLYRPSQLRYYRRHRPSWEYRLLRERLRRRYGLPRVEAWSEAERTP